MSQEECRLLLINFREVIQNILSVLKERQTADTVRGKWYWFLPLFFGKKSEYISKNCSKKKLPEKIK